MSYDTRLKIVLIGIITFFIAFVIVAYDNYDKEKAESARIHSAE